MDPKQFVEKMLVWKKMGCAGLMLIILSLFLSRIFYNYTGSFILQPQGFQMRVKLLRMFTPKTCHQNEDIQHERRQTVTNFCQVVNITSIFESRRTNNILDTHVWVDDDRKIVMCSISKAGGTYWRFLLMATQKKYIKTHGDVLHNNDTIPNFRSKEAGFYPLHKLTTAEAQWRLKKYFKVLFIRHPMDRILSAYRFYLTPRNTDKPSLNKDALSKIAEIQQEKGKGSSNLTFSEFVDHMIKTYRTGTGFSQFRVWDSYIKHCDPCAIQYDYISKFENMKQEGVCPYSYFTGKDESEIPTLQHTSHSSFRSSAGGNTQDMIRAYFTNLSGTQMLGLKSIVNNDCLMFGYDCEKYY